MDSASRITLMPKAFVDVSCHVKSISCETGAGDTATRLVGAAEGGKGKIVPLLFAPKEKNILPPESSISPLFTTLPRKVRLAPSVLVIVPLLTSAPLLIPA